jgi:hypothetical protein
MIKAQRLAGTACGIFCSLALFTSACGEVPSIDDVGSLETEGEDVGQVTSALVTAGQHSLVINHLTVLENASRTVE